MKKTLTLLILPFLLCCVFKSSAQPEPIAAIPESSNNFTQFQDNVIYVTDESLIKFNVTSKSFSTLTTGLTTVGIGLPVTGTSSDEYIYLVNYPSSGSRELYVSNGEASGTSLLQTFSDLDYETPVGNTLYFSADDGTSGTELWKSVNGSSPELVADLAPGTASGVNMTTEPVAFNNMLIFNNGSALWKSDGTATGTEVIYDFSGNEIINIDTAGSTIYITLAHQAEELLELWMSDGTAAGTSVLKSGFPYSLGDNMYSFISGPGGEAFFIYYGGYSTFAQLWKTDNTEAGTVMIQDLGPVFARISGIFRGNIILYTNSDGFDQAIWVSDGTTEGTYLFRDNMLASRYYFPLVFLDNQMFFIDSRSQDDYNIAGAYRENLWQSDLTQSGTKPLYEMFPETETTYAWTQGVTVVGDHLVFSSQEREDLGGGNVVTGETILYMYDPVQVVTASKSSVSSDFNVFPNPVTDVINIESFQLNLFSFVIRDIAGKMVASDQAGIKTGSGTSINVSNLEKGIYFIQVFEHEEPTEVIKFVKQ